MGMSVRVEGEGGDPVTNEVLDPGDLLHRLLPPHDDASYQCLRFIDWYGDTVFNRLQIPVFLEEIARTRQTAHGVEERRLLDSISELAEHCQKDVHLYLKFYGD
jgi:hypothetical protein